MFPELDMSEGLASMFKFVMNPDFGGGVDDVQKTVAEFNEAAYDLAIGLNSSVIKPIAATILAIILVLELARIGSRFDGDQKLGVQQVATAMIKAILVIIAIQNVDMILGAINQVGDTAISAAGGGGNPDIGSSVSYPSAEELKEAGLPAQVITAGILLVPGLVNIIASIVLKVIVFVRFAEIYVLSAAATLPLVFIAHPETKAISVGYLKKCGAAVLQGVVIIIIVQVFQAFKSAGGLGSGKSISATDLIGTTFAALPAMTLSSIVFLFMIISSGRLARALVGE